jgi:hypothetical protein
MRVSWVLVPIQALLLSGCAVATVAGAAVAVGVGVVSIGVSVVETTVDVAAAGVKAVAGSDDDKKEDK